LTWDELNFAQILIEERVLSDPEVARAAASRGDVAGMLDTAIQLEKDSVLLYSELLQEVDEKDAPAVQEIIDEEKRHVVSLVEAKRMLKAWQMSTWSWWRGGVDLYSRVCVDR
jgi:rubrerythrin